MKDIQLPAPAVYQLVGLDPQRKNWFLKYFPNFQVNDETQLHMSVVIRMKIQYCLLMVVICSHMILGQSTTLPAHDSFEIKSIDSDDFEDLKPLDSFIIDKRIVMLGESQHGVNDFNQMKYRLIRYLNQQHGFDVVIFESGIGYAGLTNLVKDSLSGMEILVRSLSGIWRVKGNCQLMDYMRERKMELAGMDPNSTSLGPTLKLYEQILKDKHLAKRFAATDSVMLYRYQIVKGKWKFNDIPFDKSKIDSLRMVLKKQYIDLASEVTRSEKIPPDAKNIIKRSIQASLIDLSTGLDKKADDYFISGKYRDQLMAGNLEYLVDTLYKNKKIIVWAHNAHIARSGVQNFNDDVSTLTYVQPRIKDQALVVGLFMTSGSYAWGMNKPQTFTPDKGSLEQIYSGFSSKALFVATRNMQSKKLFQGIPNFKAVTPMLYDALIFVKDTEASRLIPFNKKFDCE